MTLKRRQSSEALEHILANLLELNSEYPVQNNLIQIPMHLFKTFSTYLMRIYQISITQQSPKH